MIKDNKYVQIAEGVVCGAVTITSMVLFSRVFDGLIPPPAKKVVKTLTAVGKWGLEGGIGKAVWDASCETCDNIIEIVQQTIDKVKEPGENKSENDKQEEEQ